MRCLFVTKKKSIALICLNHGWNSCSVDSSKHLFYLSHCSSWLLTNLYNQLQKKGNISKVLGVCWESVGNVVYICKKNNGLGIEFCGTSASTLNHEDI